MIDLHIHTNMSDGQYSPGEVVAMAAERGISVLAIADHETVAGLAQGSSMAAELGIGFIPAVEISVEGNRELHILGYYVDYSDASLLELCERRSCARSSGFTETRLSHDAAGREIPTAARFQILPRRPRLTSSDYVHRGESGSGRIDLRYAEAALRQVLSFRCRKRCMRCLYTAARYRLVLL